MKALVYTEYGSPDVLESKEVEKTTPKNNKVLKVHAASLNAADWHMLTANIFPMRLMGVGLFNPESVNSFRIDYGALDLNTGNWLLDTEY